MSVETLAQALLEAGILDASSVEIRVPRARTGRVLLDSIVGDGLVTEASLVNQLARALSVPRYDPKERSPEPDALSMLDARTSDDLGVLPVAVRGGGALLWVAMCDPTDEQLLAEVARRTGRRVKACLIGPRELSRALHQLQGGLTGTHATTAAAPPQQSQTGQYRAPPQPSMPPPPSPQQMQAQLQQQMQAQMQQQQLQQQQQLAQQQQLQQQAMYGQVPGMMPGGLPMQSQYPYGYPSQPMMPAAPMPGMPSHAPGKPPEMQKLEDELAQAKQVVKVLAQLLVERGVIDGEELKRRLRAERERK